MKLDRTLQKQLLEQMAEAYPEQINVGSKRELGDPVTINLWYLEQHGLIEATKSKAINAPPYVASAAITHRGLDFLADDGGLSAILDTVTVKLHADTIRDLLEARITNSDMPEIDKKRLIDHIRSLPSEGLKTATAHLVELGLDHLTDAIPLLQKLLGF